MGEVSAFDRIITDRVIQERESARMTKTDLAARLGLTKQGYAHYEKHEATFSIEQIFSISRVLGRSVEYFLGLDNGLTPAEDKALAAYRRAESGGQGELALRLLDAVAGER
jgi:transcriptional regulator with XRE-family HTH domain